MDPDLDEVPEPPDEAVDIAHLLLNNMLRRGMEYEEYTFEVEDGPEDGEEYKVIVMKI